jgi:ATP synthase protein I
VSGSGAPPPGRGRRLPPDTSHESPGWTVFGYLLSGMIVYGGLGWLIGRWVHSALFFPLGMVIGLALAIVLVIFRFGRSGSAGDGKS